MQAKEQTVKVVGVLLPLQVGYVYRLLSEQSVPVDLLTKKEGMGLDLDSISSSGRSAKSHERVPLQQQENQVNSELRRTHAVALVGPVDLAF